MNNSFHACYPLCCASNKCACSKNFQIAFCVEIERLLQATYTFCFSSFKSQFEQCKFTQLMETKANKLFHNFKIVIHIMYILMKLLKAL